MSFLSNSKLTKTGCCRGSTLRKLLRPSYTYCSCGDALHIYLCKADPFMVEHTARVFPGVGVDYSANDLFMGIEIIGASSKIGCDFMDTAAIVDGRSAFQLSASYDAAVDVLTVRFVESSAEGEMVPAHEEERLSFRVDQGGRLVGVDVKNASISIA